MDHARRAPRARERFAQLTNVGLLREVALLLAEMERIAPLEEPARLSIVHSDLHGTADGRTWLRARYRAIYSAALVADYGHTIGDRALRDAGLWALAAIQEGLSERLI
jgi:hypothetical protein